MKVEELYAYFLKHPLITTDTRSITTGSIFFALKGDHFNGNEFAAQALEAGACYAVIDEQPYKNDDRYLLVNDVLHSLQELARYHRKQLKIPVIGITGTNGKTTTKELVNAVLAQKFKTYATRGNLNNHIGVPLTILSIDAKIEIAIIEMGANHMGEIAFLCEIAQPQYGLITNVGKAHLEGFGSFEGVKKAKGELYDWLAEHEGILFLQQDNEELVNMANQRTFKHIISYGTRDDHTVWGQVYASNPNLAIQWYAEQGAIQEEVTTNLTGRYNLENVLAAIAIGVTFGLSPNEINSGLAQYRPTNNRSQIKKTLNNMVICDYYNANASSMQAALENLDQIEGTNKGVILGDMFELGEESYKEHLRVIKEVMNMKLKYRMFVGKAFYAHRNEIGEQGECYSCLDEVIRRLSKNPIKDALILLKASRGMTFEEILNYL